MKRDAEAVLYDMCNAKDKGRDYIWEALIEWHFTYESDISKCIAKQLCSLIGQKEKTSDLKEKKAIETRIKNMVLKICKLPRLQIYKDTVSVVANGYTFKDVEARKCMVGREISKEYFKAVQEIVSRDRHFSELYKKKMKSGK